MRLWLISQDVNDGYDTYDSAVVAAATEDEARHSDVGSAQTWCSPEHVTVKLIGEAAEGIPAGVVLASFNAG